MIYSIRAIIRGLVAPDHRLSCPSKIWGDGLTELRRRGQGRRESGAFLLGIRNGKLRSIYCFVFYDDLDPLCLDSGIVVFDGAGYGKLWQLCRESGLTVVADIHTHLGLPYQSLADRNHPMVAVVGHIALIVPNLAARPVQTQELGIYEYKGAHNWINHSEKSPGKFFYIGIWG